MNPTAREGGGDPRAGDRIALVSETRVDVRQSQQRRLRLGISACLLGENVRFDGGHTVPLVVPLTLFNHHIRRLGVSYLAGQIYLNPHPAELMLRSRV